MPYSGTAPDRRKVVKNAPDALVYLNGRLSVPSGANPNKRVNIQNLITQIGVQKSVENPPGSANFSMHVPTHHRDDLFRGGYPVITTMMEVQIYMKGNFSVGGAPRYYPVFWGVTQSVSHSWSGGKQTIKVSCQDMLYWWKISKINVNPSMTARGANMTRLGTWNQHSKGWFTNENPFDIIYTLSRFAFGDSINSDLYNGLREHRSEPSEDQQKRMMAYWTRRWGRLRHSLRMLGPKGRVIQGSNLAKEKDDKGDNTPSGKKSSGKKHRNRAYGAGVLNAREVFPFKENIGNIPSFNIFKSKMTTKLEIANDCKDALNYEFFQDVTGEIIFKPPFWNMDVIPNYPVSWVRPIDLIDESHNENPPSATMIESSGDLLKQLEIGTGQEEKPKAVYVDYRLVEKYGWRPASFDSSYFGTGIEEEAPYHLFFHLVDRLDRENLNVHSGSVSIPLRPEMRMGYPIYLEHRDSFYYVNEISHTFNYGSQCTTSLSLKGRRKKFYAPFDSWAMATKSSQEDEKDLPEPGEEAPVNTAPANIHNRPPDPRSGFPKADENVNLAFKDLSNDQEKARFEDEKERGMHPDSFDPDEQDDQVFAVQKNLAEMRSQFGIDGQGTYVYRVDPNKGNPIERDDKGRTTDDSPLTSLEMDKETIEVIEGKQAKPRKTHVGTFPVSDERGYEVIGAYEYGRSVSVNSGGLNFDRNSREDAVESLLNMSPDDQQIGGNQQGGRNKEMDALKDSNLKINPNNYGRRLAEVEPKGDVSPGVIAHMRNLTNQLREQKKSGKGSGGQQSSQTGRVQNLGFKVKTGQIGISKHMQGRLNRNYPLSQMRQGHLEDRIEIIQQMRRRYGLSEEQVPTYMVLALMQQESGGSSSPNKSGSFRGILQIGDPNAKDGNAARETREAGLEPTSNDADDYRSNRRFDREKERESVKQFLAYQKAYKDSHDWNPDLMALTWKGGSGTAQLAKKLEEQGKSDAEISRRLQNSENKDLKKNGEMVRGARGSAAYLAEFRKGLAKWRKRAKRLKEVPDPPDEQSPPQSQQQNAPKKPKDSPTQADKAGRLHTEELNEKINEQFESPGLFAKKFEENLIPDDSSEAVADALPSDIDPPSNESVLPIINQYLKLMYEQAYEQEKATESELRGEGKRSNRGARTGSMPENLPRRRPREDEEEVMTFSPEEAENVRPSASDRIAQARQEAEPSGEISDERADELVEETEEIENVVDTDFPSFEEEQDQFTSTSGSEES